MEKKGGLTGTNNRGKRPKKDFYLVSAPWWMRALFPGCTWDIKTDEKIIYLSFDDGPHPVITPFVLQQLKQYNAKATFFCIGDNVLKFPATYRQVIAEGHAVGNHTMHHLNGWKHTDEKYLDDIAAAGACINSSLFRPPYGRIKRSQLKKLLDNKRDAAVKKTNYQVVMWSVLTGDWDESISPEKCFGRMQKKIYPGCIVVFHDSEKAEERMRYALPGVLQYYSALGYQFRSLDAQHR